MQFLRRKRRIWPEGLEGEIDKLITVTEYQDDRLESYHEKQQRLQQQTSNSFEGRMTKQSDCLQDSWCWSEKSLGRYWLHASCCGFQVTRNDRHYIHSSLGIIRWCGCHTVSNEFIHNDDVVQDVMIIFIFLDFLLSSPDSAVKKSNLTWGETEKRQILIKRSSKQKPKRWMNVVDETNHYLPGVSICFCCSPGHEVSSESLLLSFFSWIWYWFPNKISLREKTIFVH
jgi:hypothetical protein